MNPLAILTAASAIALAGAAAYAQPAAQPQQGQQQRRPAMTAADMTALTDAKIAGIQAGLKLTPEQQKLWPPVEQALRAQAAQHAKFAEEFRSRNQSERPDMMTIMERASDRTSQAAETLKNLTTAMKPFWASLDENQKKLLPVLMRPMAAGRIMRMREHERMMEHHGRGRGGKAPQTQQ
ncbi:Spy/CpxP family protein refolding chaperone [Microvirga flavescens]|uniref:Spy/CpxP family protein refolding chaperone n=1 Tax=Microvirga flavescens TaxID=2249811 RepID=UPI001300B4B0|nr:Spy/CpxP family protein refolding chaperone [Microvirga flavescens]